MVLRLRDRADLWTLLMPPTVWATHFLYCYVVAAVQCAKAGISLTAPEGGQAFAALGMVRPLVAAGTAVALLLIVIGARQAWRHTGGGFHDLPHDAATPEDRQRFLGYATLLLSALSFVSVIFIALPAFLIRDCR
ncbi:hypothetical protein BKE38_16780 [Pseudoroseomonas deserti]|uniref:Uncharacterized protein n=1 Tax=Teichococcus deserti TaxID=1817963 RepID=A0A1V2GZR6_9PROT|nr:hypothetical protein [Pseudoroseomonas deserti]ONG51090.1 hypothetical protein BKE38_16780 [Pseudoroseomonas deserti]